MLTFQDFQAASDKPAFLLQAILQHKASDLYRMARTADKYDHQQNETINGYVQAIFKLSGIRVANFTASNAKLASNYVNRLTTQRTNYLLGNGISFSQHLRKEVTEKGQEITIDETKKSLPQNFDTIMKNVAYFGLLHGVSFVFQDLDRPHLLKVTELCPFYDENDGTLRAAAQFWQLSNGKPLTVVLYEADGITKYRQDADSKKLLETEAKRAYKRTIARSQIDGEETIIGEENYDGRLPIVPFWGSRLRQSILVGKQQTIDAFDLINSGFANDLQDCSQIYWLIENYGGMSDEELENARQRMLFTHMLPVDTSQGGKVTPFVQEVPWQARKERLDSLRSQIYEDFACLDVHTVAAGATNDHIDAAYQPVDDAADDLEYQMIDFLQRLLALQGIEDTPVFKRNRISNQREQTDMVLSAAAYLDEETVLQKLPFISPDEVQGIMARRDAENEGRFQQGGTEEDD